MQKKDSRYRFRNLDSIKDESEESELETDGDVCVLLLSNVRFPKESAPKKIKDPKPKSPFAEFYLVLNNCRREARKTNAKLR